jgi:hypothetical protein
MVLVGVVLLQGADVLAGAGEVSADESGGVRG